MYKKLLIGKDQSLKLEVKERPDVGVFVKVGIIKQPNIHQKPSICIAYPSNIYMWIYPQNISMLIFC